jgi:hypothetical protein
VLKLQNSFILQTMKVKLLTQKMLSSSAILWIGRRSVEVGVFTKTLRMKLSLDGKVSMILPNFHSFLDKLSSCMRTILCCKFSWDGVCHFFLTSFLISLGRWFISGSKDHKVNHTHFSVC